jgi:hypothetical protein
MAAEDVRIRVHRFAFSPPQGHVLAALRDESSGHVIAVQRTDDGDYVCLWTGEGAVPTNSPIFARDDGRRDYGFLLPEPANRGVELRRNERGLRIDIRGGQFSEYRVADVPRPFFYPVFGPDGQRMTRGYPMDKNRKDESKDHQHHRSLWFAHGDVNGVDFWSEQTGAGTIRNTGLTRIVSGPVFGSFRETNEWVTVDGKVVCSDRRTTRVYAADGARLMDLDITVRASHGPVKFGDTKEGTMAMRVAPTLRLKGSVAAGHILTSAGRRDGEAWGSRAAWVDYTGPVEGKPVGVALFDHPSNLRHPTWWHARDYGLFAANPFGIHNFENEPAGTGDHDLPAGEEITFRYRIYMHRGEADTAHLDAMFADYAG